MTRHWARPADGCRAAAVPGRRTRGGAVAAALAVALLTPIPAHAGYLVTNLGLVPGAASMAPIAIADNGLVVGQGRPVVPGPNIGFYWSASGGMRSFDTFTPIGMNASGTVSGAINDPTYFYGTPYTWTAGGGLQALSLPDGTFDATAYAATQDGKVLVNTEVGLFLWSPGSGYTQITDQPGRGVMNAAGVVAGVYSTVGNFRWTAVGGLTPLDPLAGGDSMLPNGINDAGVVAGASFAGSIPSAALWSAEGVPTALPTLTGTSQSAALGLNALGQAVGTALIAGQRTALLWSGGTVTDLNSLIAPDSGWVLQTAVGINAAGQITGSGLYNGQSLAYVLTPGSNIPEPASAALLGAGLLGLALFRRRRARG